MSRGYFEKTKTVCTKTQEDFIPGGKEASGKKPFREPVSSLFSVVDGFQLRFIGE